MSLAGDSVIASLALILVVAAAVVETIFRQRVVSLKRSREESYAERMVTVSYRVAEPATIEI